MEGSGQDSDDELDMCDGEEGRVTSSMNWGVEDFAVLWLGVVFDENGDAQGDKGV